jgi:hypothetical protein
MTIETPVRLFSPDGNMLFCDNKGLRLREFLIVTRV